AADPACTCTGVGAALWLGAWLGLWVWGELCGICVGVWVWVWGSPGCRCSCSSALDTSACLICLGSTPIAPSARAWLRYSSPSWEVYIMIGMVAVRGLFLIACTAWKPSIPGMR